jgi:hypothetical protein
MKRLDERLTVLLGGIGLLVGASDRALAVDCFNLRLMDASGVIGPKQRYTFTAGCNEQHKSSSTRLTWTGIQSTSVNTGFSFTVTGKGSWERKTGEAEEALVLSGDVAGKRFTRGVCNEDPFLKDPPGGAAHCTGVQTQYKSEKGPVYEVLVGGRFFLSRTVALVEAQALSQQKPAASNPPPPPPAAVARKTLTSPSGARAWEAEDLFRSNKVTVNGGQLGAQPMQGFGAGWSGDTQLFWGGGGVGAVIDLTVDVQKAGRYRVTADLTRAPDFATLGAEVDGQASGLKFDGFSPQVVREERVELGAFTLGPGPRKISFLIVGKNSQSSSYRVGIDRLVLTPLSRPPAGSAAVSAAGR